MCTKILLNPGMPGGMVRVRTDQDISCIDEVSSSSKKPKAPNNYLCEGGGLWIGPGWEEDLDGASVITIIINTLFTMLA